MWGYDKRLALNGRFGRLAVPVDIGEGWIGMRMPGAFVLRSVLEGLITDPGGPVVPIPRDKFHSILCPGFIESGCARMGACVICQFRCDDRAECRRQYPQYDLAHGLSRAVLSVLLVMSIHSVHRSSTG